MDLYHHDIPAQTNLQKPKFNFFVSVACPLYPTVRTKCYLFCLLIKENVFLQACTIYSQWRQHPKITEIFFSFATNYF